MEKIKVIINQNGITAREVNKCGDKKPSNVANWEKAEKELRTFEIDSEHEALKIYGGKENFEKGEMKIESANVLYEPNSIHYAVTLVNGKIKIIPDKDSFYEKFAKKVQETPVTDEINFIYTKLGEPNFIKKGSDWADKQNSISLRDWKPEQLEEMAKFIRNNPLCTLYNDGSGDLNK